MAVEQAVWLHEGDCRQTAIVDSSEEVRGVFDVGGPLLRVTHNRVGIRRKVADVAVGCTDQDARIAGAWTRLLELLELHGSVVRSAVVRPGDVLVVKHFADGRNVA